MIEPLHIIIGSEQGTLRTFTLSRKNFRKTCLSIALVFSFLSTAGFFTAGYFVHNRLLIQKVEALTGDLQIIKEENRGLGQELAGIQKKTQDQIATLTLKNNLLISNLRLKNSHNLAELEKKNLEKVTTLEQEKDLLLSTAVNELNERNALIADVMKNIGIKVKLKKGQNSSKNSGGPYIPLEDKSYHEILERADKYIETIRSLPLGKPVPGPITSRYGSRVDPLKKTKAFHSGIDFRGKHGEKVRATASGKVVFAGRNGSFGNFVRINHGNGYETSFAHMQNYHVKKGDRVTRGQVVGLVGSSGRSTGPHLHYEVKRHGKTVNPYKFIKL